MKYVRKVTALIISVILVAAIAIGIGVIFAVRNVNVTLLSYDAESDGAKDSILSVKNSISGKCGGTVISFVNEDDVLSVLDERYTLESFEKVYPCTINVTIKERMDVFAVADADGYRVYDEDGEYFTNSATLNNIFDGSASNILLEGIENDYDVRTVAGVCATFKNSFSSLRPVVERVELDKALSNLANDRITFYLRCGLCVEVQDYSVSTREKLNRAYAEFSSLNGEKKLTGKIYAFSDANGDVRAVYLANP